MLMIRLKRVGRTNDPSFRIVVGEKIYSPKSGKHFAYLGSYNPKTKATIIDEPAVKDWIGKGAQLSDTVHNLFLNKGLIQGKKINILPAFKAAPVEEQASEEPTPTPAPADMPADAPAEEAPAEAPAEEAKAE